MFCWSCQVIFLGLLSKRAYKVTVEKLAEKSERHMKLRWIGVPFFVCGLMWFIVALTKTSMIGWFPVMLSVASTLMGLTCFGLHHDTGVQLGRDIQKDHPEFSLPEIVQRELRMEYERDKANVLSLKGHPTLAMILPFFVLLVHTVVVYWLWF